MADSPVCFDTSVLRYFSQAGAMSILKARYGDRAHTSEETRVELQYQDSHGTPGLGDALAALDDWIAVWTIDDPGELAEFTRLKTIFSRQPHLGRGEAATIVVARRLGAVAAIDERAARAHANRNGVQVIGTIGILRAATGDGSLSWAEAEAIFGRMIAAGFRAPAPTLRATIARLGRP
jgi:predicted nucleic acid-binding protein